MVELVDMPNFKRSNARKKYLPWALTAAVVLLLTAMSWGESIPMGSANGYQVGVTFLSPYSVSPEGKVDFPNNETLRMEVEIKNTSNASGEVQVQTSLHTNGGKCGEMSLTKGARLPGASVSAPFMKKMAPGSRATFQVTYDAPANLCDVENLIKVSLMSKDRSQSQKIATFVSPIEFRLK